ncbi:hypothetical protein LTS10_007206 [Elasticomyces elasticus]|nr:hypothetical protein LTS10_007206 [Elasticomyces elasticus]
MLQVEDSHVETSSVALRDQPAEADNIKDGADGGRPLLLLLPQELRDFIYELAIVDTEAFVEHPIRLGFSTSHRDTTNSCIRTYLALSATNQQVREESRACFFGNNTFGALVNWKHGAEPLDGLSHVLKYMKHVVLYRLESTEDYVPPACILDLRFRGVTVQSHTVVAPHATLTQAVGAHCCRFEAVELASESLQRKIEEKSQQAIHQLQEGVSEAASFDQNTLTALIDDLMRAWTGRYYKPRRASKALYLASLDASASVVDYRWRGDVLEKRRRP